MKLDMQVRINYSLHDVISKSYSAVSQYAYRKLTQYFVGKQCNTLTAVHSCMIAL